MPINIIPQSHDDVLVNPATAIAVVIGPIDPQNLGAERQVSVILGNGVAVTVPLSKYNDSPFAQDVAARFLAVVKEELTVKQRAALPF